MAFANGAQLPGLETVFFLTSAAYARISSSIVRDVYRRGGDVSPFVPAAVAAFLKSTHHLIRRSFGSTLTDLDRILRSRHYPFRSKCPQHSIRVLPPCSLPLRLPCRGARRNWPARERTSLR